MKLQNRETYCFTVTPPLSIILSIQSVVFMSLGLIILLANPEKRRGRDKTNKQKSQTQPFTAILVYDTTKHELRNVTAQQTNVSSLCWLHQKWQTTQFLLSSRNQLSYSCLCTLNLDGWKYFNIGIKFTNIRFACLTSYLSVILSLC